MSDPQAVYDGYVQQWGYVPKHPKHLIAYAKSSGAKLRFSDARQIITTNKTNNNNTNKPSSTKPNTSKSKNTTSIVTNTKKSSNKPKSNPPASTANKWPPVTTNTKKTIHKPSNSANINSSKSVTINPNKNTSNKTNPSQSNKRKSKWPPVKTFHYSNKKSSTQTPSSSNINTNKKWPVVQTTIPSIKTNTTNNITPHTAKPSTPITPPPPPINKSKPPPVQTSSKIPSKISKKPSPIKANITKVIKPNNNKVSTPITAPPPPKQNQIVHKNKPPPRSKSKSNATPPPRSKSKSNATPPIISPPNKKNQMNKKTVSAPPKRGLQKPDVINPSTTPPPPASIGDDCKLPPDGPRIKGKLSETKFPHPPPRIKSQCDDEKMIPKETARAFMLRINYECKTMKVKQEIYNALKSFSNVQINTPNPGTITYHCTTPDPIKYPLKLEIIELYYNENAYMKMMECKSAQFDRMYNKNVKSQSVVTIGDNVSDTIKKVIRNKYKSTFPKTEAGYIFHGNYLKALDYTDDTKLMFKFHLISPKYNEGNRKNIEIIFDIMDRLSVYGKESYALMFHCHRLDIKTYPHYLELISIWPNIECLLEFLQNNKAQMIMMEFKQFMIKQTDKFNRKNHFLCELYSGNEIPDNVMVIMGMVFDEIGYTQQIKTDIGYILHPKANSSKLN